MTPESSKEAKTTKKAVNIQPKPNRKRGCGPAFYQAELKKRRCLCLWAAVYGRGDAGRAESGKWKV